MKDQVDALRRARRRRRRADVRRPAPTSSAQSSTALRDGAVRAALRRAGAVRQRRASVDALASGGAARRWSRSTRRTASSEWGHDFRPDYAPARPRCRAALGAPPAWRFTATATPQVRRDIARAARAERRRAVHVARLRPAEPARTTSSDGTRRRQAAAELVELVRMRDARRRRIVYAATRKNAEKHAAALARRACAARVYHAGLDDRDARDARRTRSWPASSTLIVATNAFGMGVDKRDIRLRRRTANLPRSLEAYYQEAGRAGRDGQPARCVLLFYHGDRGIIANFIKQARFNDLDVADLLHRAGRPRRPGDQDVRRRPRRRRRGARGAGGGRGRRARSSSRPAPAALARAAAAARARPGAGAAVNERARRVERTKWDQLDAAQGFAEAEGCRRERLLRHFGDRSGGAPIGRCCDVCDPPPALEVTVERAREPRSQGAGRGAR